MNHPLSHKGPFKEEPLPHEDLALVQAALKGQEPALEYLADRTQIVPRILSRLNQRWGQPLSIQDIEDLSQDVVISILKKLEGYQGLSPFDAWIFRFCSFQLRNRVRREVFRRKVVTNIESESPDPVVEQPDPSDQIDGKALWSYVEELDAMDRKIVHAKHARGLSFTEIAELLETAPSSVKTRYYRSLEQIRARVRQQQPVDTK